MQGADLGGSLFNFQSKKVEKIIHAAKRDHSRLLLDSTYLRHQLECPILIWLSVRVEWHCDHPVFCHHTLHSLDERLESSKKYFEDFFLTTKKFKINFH